MSIFEQLGHVDLNQTWISLRSNRNGESILHVEKKTNFGRFKAVVLQILTFGKFGHKRGDLEKIASIIHRKLSRRLRLEHNSNNISGILDFTAYVIHKDTIPQDLKTKMLRQLNGNIGKISRACPDSQVKLETINPNLNAISLYRKNDDIDAVLNKYLDLKKQDSKYAEKFLLRSDSEGKTVFHYLLDGFNLQKSTLDSIQSKLNNDELMSQCLVSAKDNSGNSMLDYAIKKGEMAVIAKFFPIPDGPKLPLKDEDIVHLQNKTIPNVIESLSTGENSYDKMNHILSALHALACNGFLDTISDYILSQAMARKPLAAALMTFFVLDGSELIREYEGLCAECTQLSSVDEVSAKMDEWKVGRPTTREPADYISFNQFYEQLDDKNSVLFELFSKALTEKKVSLQNAYINILSELLDPFAAYDQKVDFNNRDFMYQKQISILYKIFNDLAENEEIDLGLGLELVEKLICKCPELIGDQQDIISNLDRMQSERAEQLKQQLESIIDSLPMKSFQLSTKKALKYYLEARGCELSQR